MSKRTSPYRADHVGSLLRAPGLLAARDESAAGRISAEELQALEDAAIRDAVRMQRDIGLQGGVG
jgi:5-methyltetrahydropteroyltriglutamate--homocysteine methyltransferase